MKSLNAVHASTLLLTLGCLAAGSSVPQFSLAGAVLTLSFLHFAATLQLFYREEGVVKNHPLLSLGIPILLFLAFSAGAILWRSTFAGALVLFFPLLLWHYAKQSMGLFVLSLRPSPAMDRPNSASRQYILFVFMLLGTFGYLNSQTASMLTQTFGFYVPSLELPAGPWVNYLRIICLSGVAGCIYLAIRARSYWAICTPLAFYLWVDYPLTNFALLPILPALHAIQYLPLAFERGVKGRGAFWFAVSTSVAAALLFGLLRTAPRHLLSIGVVVAMAELTLNLHHYFLDAHIWRARVGKYRRAMGYEET